MSKQSEIGVQFIPRGNPRSSTSAAARILVVDDNVDLAQGLAKLLQILGHQVQVAHDGPSGLDTARRSNPEIIILDIGLPGMDGYQVAAHIREEEATKGVVMIAITGYGQDEDRRRAKEAGFDHHLVKPIASQVLIEIIQGSRG